MRIEIIDNSLIAHREPGDPKYRDVEAPTWGTTGESRLLHAIKKHLNANGNDLIKVLMWRDGHMVSEFQHYLRTRSPKSPGLMGMIWNPNYAIEGANQDWNESGKAIFAIERLDPKQLPRREFHGRYDQFRR